MQECAVAISDCFQDLSGTANVYVSLTLILACVLVFFSFFSNQLFPNYSSKTIPKAHPIPTKEQTLHASEKILQEQLNIIGKGLNFDASSLTDQPSMEALLASKQSNG